MAAIKAGKHVYTEKPLSYTVHEARQLTHAAREAGVATQMGNQGHSSESAAQINDWVEGGRQAFADLKCTQCHLVPSFPELAKMHDGKGPGPDLTRVLTPSLLLRERFFFYEKELSVVREDAA